MPATMDGWLVTIAQFKPLLLSEAIVLGAAILDTYRQRMNIERMVFYTALSSVFLLLFSNLIAFWFWLLPICLLYAIVKEKKDLGAFMLVFGTSVTFLEVTYAFSSNYLIFGNFGAILPGIEGVKNALKITSIMASSLAIILLFGRAGVISSLLSDWFALPRSRWIYGWPGICLAQLLAFAPIAFLVLIGVVQGISPSFEEAAQTLRARRWTTCCASPISAGTGILSGTTRIAAPHWLRWMKTLTRKNATPGR